MVVLDPVELLGEKADRQCFPMTPPRVSCVEASWGYLLGFSWLANHFSVMDPAASHTGVYMLSDLHLWITANHEAHAAAESQLPPSNQFELGG